MPISSPVSILNVSTNDTERLARSRLLQGAGFQVWDAASGAEALQRATAGPGLVILDLTLGDMSGFEVCCRIKARPGTAVIPVVHISPTLVEESGPAHAREQGQEAYLLAPVPPRELLATVRALLRERPPAVKFSGFLEAAPDAVVIVDGQGRIVQVNARTEQLFGYERGELHGREIEVLLPERFRAAHVGYRQGYLAYPATRPMGIAREVFGRRKDGSDLPVLVSLSPLPTSAGVLVASVIRDVSIPREREECLRQRARELEQADQQKNECLAVTAHELRNPITAIRNIIQILKELHPTDSRVQWAIGAIDRQTDQLSRLVEDLVDISRLIHGKFSLRRELLELNDILTQAVEACRPMMEARRQVLTVALPEQPVCLEGDRGRLSQIWSNLLTNAAKYTEEGGHIWLTAEREAGGVQVHVRDNGLGIAPEMLPRVFELFSQGAGALDHSQGGLGIGLALVRRLVELHGGTIDVHSAGLSQGSTFTVHLPLSVGTMAPVAV